MGIGTAPESTPTLAQSGPSESGVRLAPLKSFGFLLAVAFFVLMFPAMKLAGIPIDFSISSFVGRYLAVALQGIVYAMLLAAVGFPEEIVTPARLRYKNPVRVLILCALAVLFFYIYRNWVAAVVLILAIGILEAYERAVPLRSLAKPLLPGLYLFIGLVAVFGFNAVAVTIRFQPAYDSILRTIDSYLLFGHSVSELSHRFCAVAPSWFVNLLMFSYLALFAQIGAALLLTTLRTSLEKGMRFVSTILVAYLFSMIVFVSFPTHSPYFTCATHATAPLPTPILEAQQALMSLAKDRWNKVPMPIETEYYVAFPCMHIAQPLIVLWFLRRWKRILAALVVIDIVLTAAIVLLEWHYVTDLIGGVLVAAAAIGFVEWMSKRRKSPTAAN